MMKKVLKILSYVLVASLASALTFGYMVYTEPMYKLTQLQALIEECFIGDYDEIYMEDAAADAMIGALGDRWSYYIPAADYEAYEEEMSNSYVGIGITILSDEDGAGIRVESVKKEGPAAEAGMLPGDIIVAIDDRNTQGMTTTEVRNLVRGEEGTTLTITVMRYGEAVTLYVTRRIVDTVVAEGKMLSSEIGYVKILNFDTRCAQETLNAIKQLQDAGVKALIFDVRNNPGGYANELVKILDYLLPEGELFRAEDYSGKVTVDRSDAQYLDLPMAVLVNGESYSAAEFFAAAMMDYDAATVVGEQTCGKGYFQNTFQLDDGSAVGLSVGKYYTPKGQNLAGIGIIPDIIVTVDPETAASIYYGAADDAEDPQLQAAVNKLQSQLDLKKS